jgi:predicted hydrocarbon binding protein
METSIEKNIIGQLDLDRFFELTDESFDLEDGTAFNKGNTRIIYLPEDAICGIHASLKEETGPAWKIILKNCGSIWGKKVAANLARELKMLFSVSQGDITAKECLELLERYFSDHGWGKITFDVSRAFSNGFVHVKLENSIFVRVLKDEIDLVDPMIAGILGGLFSDLAGKELDAIEIACVSKGAPYCEFVISSAGRIVDLEPAVEEGHSSEELLELLCQKTSQ